MLRFPARVNVRSVGGLLFAVLLVTGAVAFALPRVQHITRSEKTPRGSGGVGVHLMRATPPANAFPRVSAISIAKRLAAHLTRPNADVSAAYRIVSDTDYYSIDRNGDRQYRIKDRPAWVITFSGARIPLYGRYGGEVSPNQQVSVVIDGETGKYLETYSYK